MRDEDADFRALLEGALQGMLDSMDEGAIVFDVDGVCRIVGRRVGELFGREPAHLIGRTRMETLRLLSQSAEEADSFLEDVAINDLDLPPHVHGEHELRTPRPRIVIWKSYPMVHDGKRRGRLCLVRDVTRERSAERARAALQRRLETAVPIDPLTGLWNRKKLLEDLEREHQRANRSWDTYALLCLDVDRMTELNRVNGQVFGDRVLEEVAATLKKGRREYDVLARLDADEFALVLPGADEVAAEAVSERLALSIRALRLLEGVRVTVCVGAAVWQPPAQEKSGEVLDRALAALASAREKGPSHIVVERSARTVPPAGPMSDAPPTGSNPPRSSRPARGSLPPTPSRPPSRR
jgi:diguanylate cyclase (GGDEF)-like protein/PAS domain S-box-containing protein